MSVSSTAPNPLHSDEQSVAQYRSVSRTALVALGLGIASALALASPVLSPIALFAIVAAVISLRGIRQSGGQVVGRVPAILGLGLAMFFLGWSTAHSFSRENALEGRAREFAEAWLTLVAHGELQQADQMRIPAHTRMQSGEAIKEFYEQNPDAAKGLTNFFSTPVMKDFLAKGSDVEFRFDSLDGSERDAESDIMTLKYTYDRPGGPNVERPLWIRIKREFYSDEEPVEWTIETVLGQPAN